MRSVIATCFAAILCGLWCIAQAPIIHLSKAHAQILRCDGGLGRASAPQLAFGGAGCPSSGGGGIGTPTKLFEGYNVAGGTYTTTTSAPSGGLNVIFTVMNTAFGSIPSTLTDSNSNTYSQAVVFQYGATGIYAGIYYCSNCTHTWASGGTVTITPAAAALAVTLTGANSGLDVTATGSSNSASPTLASGTLGQATEIVFAGMGNDGNFGDPTGFTETAPFTAIATAQHTAGNGAGNDFAYSIVASTASITYAPVWTGNSVQGPMVLASFKH